jgi:hypothetical protein
MTNLNPITIREEGLRLLIDGLGVAGMVEFLRQFGGGSGDYTAEREELLKDVTIDEIVEQIKARKESEKIG